MKIPATCAPGLKVSIIIFIRYITPDRAFVIEAENPLGSPISLVSLSSDYRTNLDSFWKSFLYVISFREAFLYLGSSWEVFLL